MYLFDEEWLLVVLEMLAVLGVVVAHGWQIVSKDGYFRGKVRKLEIEDLICVSGCDLDDDVLVNLRRR